MNGKRKPNIKSRKSAPVMKNIFVLAVGKKRANGTIARDKQRREKHMRGRMDKMKENKVMITFVT